MTAMAMSLENISLRYLYFFKIAHTIFEVILFHDFAAPFLQNDAFDLQFWQMESTQKESSLTLDSENILP